MLMNRTFILHHINNVDYIPAMERWFNRYHYPEVLAQEPWLSRYLLFRVLPPAKGMEELGFLNYHVHENWNLDIENRRGCRGLLAMTPEPYDDAMNVAIANVPAEPTHDFFGYSLGHTDRDPAFFRFITLLSFPEGVSREEGDDWFLNVHAPEACKLPGLLRFFSHRAYDREYSPLPMPDDAPAFVDPGKNLFSHRWHWLSEMWFENNSAWTKAFGSFTFTKPDWAVRDSYPFVEPLRDFVCTSILEHPDLDILHHAQGFLF